MKGVNYHLCTQRYERITVFFSNFAPSDNVLCLFDVSMSFRLPHVQFFSLHPKVILWCEREILHAKNVINKGACLNDCRIQLGSQPSLFAQSQIKFFNINGTWCLITFSGALPPPLAFFFFNFHNYNMRLIQGCTNLGPKWPRRLRFLWWCQKFVGLPYETLCRRPDARNYKMVSGFFFNFLTPG